MKITSLVAAMFFLASTSLWAQSKPKTADELAAYLGPDREKVLLEGAKAEGKVVWYTSLAGGSYKALVKAFEEKYPGVKVEVYRGGSKDIAPKVLNEAQAGKYLADALETTPGILLLFHDKKILRRYSSPALAKFPADAKIISEGNSVYWVTDRESYIGFGYNPKMIPANDVPKSYADLMKPEFKGKFALTTESTSDRVIGTMIKHKGEEFVKQLKAQDMKLFKVSGPALRDLIIAGEIAGSPAIFRNHVLVKKAEGAPIEWVPMDGVPTNAGGSAMLAKAPHPHAALLLIDFIIGSEGQEILEKFKYGVAWKDYPFKREYPERGMTSIEYNKVLKQWNKLVRSITRK
jgi:iron(III) transport system substrate-binding protein